MRTAVLSSITPPSGEAGSLRQRHAERLEDRLEHVLRIGALDQPHVQRQPGALGELSQEGGDDVAGEAGDAGVAEVDVRDDERPPGRFDDDMRERLVRRHGGRAVTTAAACAQGVRERLAERAPGRGHLGLRLARRDLEHEIEGRVLRKQPEEVVEHRHAGDDARLAGARDVDAGVGLPASSA